MSEKTYRMLEEREIMQLGDEWRSSPNDPWQAVLGLAGHLVPFGSGADFQARRPINTDTTPTLIANDVYLLVRLVGDELMRAGNDIGYTRTLLRILDTLYNARKNEATEIKIDRTDQEE